VMEEAQRLRKAGRELARHSAPPPAQDWDAALDRLEALLNEVRAEAEVVRQQRQKAEKALAEIQQQRLRLREQFAFAPDGWVVTDLQGVIEEANFAAATLFQARTDYLVQKPLGLLIAEEVRSRFYRHLMALVRGDAVLSDWRIRLRRPQGVEANVSVSASPSVDERGQSQSLYWQFRDDSARVRVEGALAAERGFASSVLNVAPAIILVLDL